jgi:UrcA family protein
MSVLPLFPRSSLLGAAALTLALGAIPATAQDYRDAAYGPTEEVIVHAPRDSGERSAIGAPIRDVALSGEVRFDDLDLTTDHGARVLQRRVRDAARDLCRRLDVRYPIATPDSPPCYRTAYDDAMAQADNAIARARGED